MTNDNNEYVDGRNSSYYDEEIDQNEESRETVATVFGWGLSLAMHAIVLLLLAFVVIAGRFLEEPIPVTAAHVDPPSPPLDEPKDEIKIEDKYITIPEEEIVPDPVVDNLDVEIEDPETEDPEVSEVSEPKGREEAVAASENGGSGAFMQIGAASSAAGPFGHRQGGGKRRALGKYGGTRRSEASVSAALRWFKRHQSPNGMWDIDGYPINCTMDGLKCEPGQSHTGADGDAAATGYAILAFLGSGHDHRTPNKFRATVEAGIDWLVANQKADGSFGDSRNYENGICTMALAEAYAMTFDPKLREPTQRGVEYILRMQGGDEEAYAGGAWDYKRPGREDSSVSGWCVMALKSAKAGGIDVANGMTGAKNWFDRTWEEANKQAGLNPTDPYTDVSIFPYSKKQGGDYKKIQAGSLKSGDGARTAIGLCVGVFLGEGLGNIKMESMANEVVKTHLPSYRSFETTNQYWMYYNTLGIFQVGGDRWLKFNDVVRDMLIEAQRKEEGCFHGSWDWETKGNDYHGAKTGRLISTAYCVLSLQVYYRYVPLDGKKPKLPAS